MTEKNDKTLEPYRKSLEKRLTSEAKTELKKLWPEIKEFYDYRDEAAWFQYFETYCIVLNIYKDRSKLMKAKKKPSVKDLFVFENLASAHKNTLLKLAYTLKLTPRSREGADKTSQKTGRKERGLRDSIMKNRNA
jgi:hypothetical protein